jgi:DNA-binding NtrC family response regulator
MNATGRVLVVEGDPSQRDAIVKCLANQKLTVFSAGNVDRAIGYIQEGFDIVLCDLCLEGTPSLSLLKAWKPLHPQTRFIVLGERGAARDAVNAIKAGADDYLAKPVDCEEVRFAIRKTLDELTQDLEAEGRGGALRRFIGQSPQMKEIFSRIARAAATISTVMVLGENGTGKERVAHALHENSPRRMNPFVALNVAAVPASLVESELFGHVKGAFTGATDRRMGRFEQANGGTLFIDEIGDFDLSLQPKLLRVLETRVVTPVGGHEDVKVDARVIVATSRNLAQMVRDGDFREDLYYRLNVVQITVPPLRQRPMDIPLLVDEFMAEIAASQHGRKRTIAPELMERLMNYSWPGNVRQLHNTLECMMVLAEGDELSMKDLPESFTEAANPAAGGGAAANLTIDEMEQGAIERALQEFKDNRKRAAARLGVSVRTLQRKLRMYELQKKAGETEGSE